MKPSEILRAGKQRIETLGWCQGDELAIHGTQTGPCCAATAIPFTLSFDEASTALDALKAANGIEGQLYLWNDAPERTLPEVLAAYDKAIAAAEAQEQSK